MNPESIFNNTIKKFLKEGEKGNNAQLINEVMRLNSNYKSLGYFAIFDDFCFRLGFGFFLQGIIDKNEKIIGYIPSFKYYPDNSLGEDPREEPIKSETPISMEVGYKIMAKEVVYKLRRIIDLEELIRSDN